ncbi:MAG: ABC transporter permease [Candidatus Babeliales bacterium]
MNISIRSARVFFEIFKRDCIVYSHQWKRLAINNWFITPAIEAICFGYIVPMVSMSQTNPRSMTAFLSGMILWVIFPLAWSFAVELMYDFEHNKFVNYLNTILNPNLVVLEKILFYSAIGFINILPFFPVCMLILGSYFDTTNLDWIKLLCILYAGSLFCAAYNVFFVCYVGGFQQVSNFWMRLNYPMINLGGTFLSWKLMASYSPLLGYALLANPLIYISEGIRNALLGPDNHFHFGLCILALIGFSLVLTLCAMHYYRKKLDTI